MVSVIWKLTKMYIAQFTTSHKIFPCVSEAHKNIRHNVYEKIEGALEIIRKVSDGK